MKFYFLPGLGADHRLFSGLDILEPSEHPSYICAQEGETLSHYCERLQKAIGYTEEDVIVGFSFGGICALEMSKHLRPKLIVMISSSRSYHGNTWTFKLQAKMLKFVPDIVLASATKYLFPIVFNSDPLLSAAQKHLIKEMGRDLNIPFFRWAAEACATWKGDFGQFPPPSPLVVIHGENDPIIPKEELDDVVVIEGGLHLIQYTHAKKVQKVVLEHLDSL